MGTEFLGLSWPIRFGLAWTNQVTDSNYAYAQFVAPAPAYTITLGTGHTCKIGERDLHMDAALEYDTLSEVEMAARPVSKVNPVRLVPIRLRLCALYRRILILFKLTPLNGYDQGTMGEELVRLPVPQAGRLKRTFSHFRKNTMPDVPDNAGCIRSSSRMTRPGSILLGSRAGPNIDDRVNCYVSDMVQPN